MGIVRMGAIRPVSLVGGGAAGPTAPRIFARGQAYRIALRPSSANGFWRDSTSTAAHRSSVSIENAVPGAEVPRPLPGGTRLAIFPADFGWMPIDHQQADPAVEITPKQRAHLKSLAHHLKA